jgi:hypothetical protein
MTPEPLTVGEDADRGCREHHAAAAPQRTSGRR